VSVRIQEHSSGREVAERRLTEALRDRLADRAVVLPESGDPASGEMGVEVLVVASKARGDVVKDSALGAFRDTAGGVGRELAGQVKDFREAVAVGIFVVAVGTVAVPVAAIGAEVRGLSHNARLGYKPRHLICRVFVKPGPGSGEVECFELGPWDVVEAMRPMTREQLSDPEALAKEEAEALAKVVCLRLERLGWRRPA
jgi:hypothetical protein